MDLVDVEIEVVFVGCGVLLKKVVKVINEKVVVGFKVLVVCGISIVFVVFFMFFIFGIFFL